MTADQRNREELEKLARPVGEGAGKLEADARANHTHGVLQNTIHSLT